MLPASFGAIQLGETFISCLSVNNEATVPVDAVTLTVEVQTASTKTVLAEFGGEGHQLAPGDSLEKVVSHEIKELGQHALACTVSYRLPPGTRASTSSDGSDPDVLVFRKFYKFAVSTSLTRLHQSSDVNDRNRSPIPCQSRRKYMCLGVRPPHYRDQNEKRCFSRFTYRTLPKTRCGWSVCISSVRTAGKPRMQT